MLTYVLVTYVCIRSDGVIISPTVRVKCKSVPASDCPLKYLMYYQVPATSTSTVLLSINRLLVGYCLVCTTSSGMIRIIIVLLYSYVIYYKISETSALPLPTAGMS